MTEPSGSAADSSARQREELRQLLKERANKPLRGPVSCAQRRLWFVHRLEGQNSSYNIACHMTIRGGLDPDLLARSLNEMSRRHAALRTTFPEVNGEPEQSVAPDLSLSLPVDDLTRMSREAAREQLSRTIAREAETLFDLTEGPLIRARLLKLSDDEHVLAVVFHHIIGDGWSIGVLVPELFRVYELLKSGSEPALPALPIQYRDYAARQARWLETDEYASHLDYWRDRLRDLPVLDLPTDRPRPLVKQHRGASHLFAVDSRVTGQLQALCRREGITLYMCLLAAFSVLLARYSRQSDVVVGTPIANRSSADVEGLVGFFVNMLVMRTDVSGNPGVRELLSRIAETTLAAYAHQDVPFERLVDELQPERDTSRNPLFQVALALQNEPMPGAVANGLEVEPPVVLGFDVDELGVGVAHTRFDMELHLWEGEEGLRGVWLYDAGLFDAETVARMSRHLEALLRGIAHNPDRRVSELEMLARDESETLLIEWARNPAAYPGDATVHELFEQQCATAPDAIALIYDDLRLSYAELNAQANQLARYLERNGARPGDLIGLCMERNAGMIVAMLGILKAGCAYVPLDRDYPASRLDFMLRDTRTRVLLTQESLKERLPGYDGRVLCVDEEREAIRREEDGDKAVHGGSLAPAYVIYTSGSTGEPKGVAVPHRAIVRLVRGTDYVQLEPGDRVVQASSVSFDAATFEIWGALLNGACVVGVDRERTLVPTRYAAFLRDQGVSVMFITTALFNKLAEHAPEAFSGLRAVLFGGEAVDTDCVRRVVRGANRPRRLLHVYGPTECTTFASWFEVEAVEDSDVTVPIGRPIANTELYVLDDDGRPVPVGVVGELYVGGDGLALGYWDRPGLTDEKFVPHPYADDPQARLYRTGDLVRWNRDGFIEFVGRVDHQVKLRGFRIELGEIENRLKQCAGVREAVVILRDDSDSDRQLVAYIVGDGDSPLSVPELRSRLQETLPGFMMPSAIVELEALPLTRNGKVDRERLPAPQPQRQREAGGDYVGARTDLERTIAGIWRDVLGVSEVGVEDNFFDLGGDSFRLVRVHAGLQQALDREVPITELFRCATVRSLAKRLGGGRADAPGTSGRVRSRAAKQRAAMGLDRPGMKE